LERIRGELATLEDLQAQHGTVTGAQLEAANRGVVLLKEQLSESKRTVDEARRRLAEAQVRVEAATPSVACVDLADMERRVAIARTKVGEDVVSDPEQAQTGVQLARQSTGRCETVMRVAKERLSDTLSRFERLAATLEQPPDQVLAEAEKEREDADKTLEGLEESSSEVEVAEKEVQEAQARVMRLEQELTVVRTGAEVATRARDESRAKHNEARGRFAPLLQSLPTTNLAVTETVGQAHGDLDSCARGSISLPVDLTTAEAFLEQKQGDLRRIENELHAAQGQLEFVGGTVAREQRDQEVEALEGLRKSAEELELEYMATKHLLYVLREADEKHTKHLGLSLAKPVTQRFLELTAGRYAHVALDTGLRVRNIATKGGERELASLSVGTRDQLATLIRLALAAHLKSVVVLDDQLTHSDRNRLDWFRDRLRANVRDHDHQIIVITSRPLDYLYPGEEPVAPCDRFETEDGRLTVVDLERVCALTSAWPPGP
jgi:hypothetical protein